MPGMKVGWNLVIGLDRYLSSWKSAEDPAVGEYSLKIDPRGYQQVMEMKGSVISTRGGSWNGLYFTGYLSQDIPKFKVDFVLNEKEVYLHYEILDRSIFFVFRVDPSGTGQYTIWMSQTRSLMGVTATSWQHACQSYAFCGPNSICTIDGNFATCECLKGYIPKFPEQWNMSHWSNGCVRKTSLDCNDTYGFLRYTDMKLPDTSSSWFNETMNLEEC